MTLTSNLAFFILPSIWQDSRSLMNFKHHEGHSLLSTREPWEVAGTSPCHRDKQHRHGSSFGTNGSALSILYLASLSPHTRGVREATWLPHGWHPIVQYSVGGTVNCFVSFCLSDLSSKCSESPCHCWVLTSNLGQGHQGVWKLKQWHCQAFLPGAGCSALFSYVGLGLQVFLADFAASMRQVTFPRLSFLVLRSQHEDQRLELGAPSTGKLRYSHTALNSDFFPPYMGISCRVSMRKEPPFCRDGHLLVWASAVRDGSKKTSAWKWTAYWIWRCLYNYMQLRMTYIYIHIYTYIYIYLHTQYIYIYKYTHIYIYT